jgi:uncharacterized HAD superfamily protein
VRYGIDCDGVIADFNTSFVREVNNIWPGKLPVNYQPPVWDMAPLTKDEINKVWEVIEKKPNWWLSLNGYPENIRAIALHRIKFPGDEIFYVTARHEVAGMPTMHQTQTWLQQCGIGGLGTAVIVDKSGSKVEIFNALECDANVDDKLAAVVEHDKRTRGAYLLSRPWNEVGRPPNLRPVTNLEEFFRKAGGINATI